MLPTLLQSLLLASAGILSPGSITLVVLLLISEGGWRKGVAYTAGYMGGYTLIGLAMVGVGYRAGAGGGGGGERLSALLSLLLGGLLLWVTVRNWRRPATGTEGPPRLFAMLDSITPARAFAFGAAVTVINVKNLGIFLSALSVLLLSPLSLPAKVAGVLLDVLVFCLSVLVPVGIYATFPHSATARLSGLKEGLERHRRPIGIWLPLLFGLLFLIRGIVTLP